MWLSGISNVSQRHKRLILALSTIFVFIVFFHNPPKDPSPETPRSVQEYGDDNQHNKTLVVVMGNLRGGEKAWGTLYRNLLDLNNADLALVVGVTPEEKKTSSLYQRAKYVWEFPEFDDWTHALDLITNNKTRWHMLLDYHKTGSGILGGCRGHDGSGAVIFWIRWFLSNQIRDHGLGWLYDRFVVTRSDHYYLCEHDLAPLDPNEVWIPGGEDCGGYTDRHVVAPASKIHHVLNILPPVLQKPRYYIHYRKRDVRIPPNDRGLYQPDMNPEGLIRLRWHEDGIFPKQFDRVMFTCAVPGDMTRWAKMSGLVVEEGVHLKYKDEYMLAHHVCWDRNLTKALIAHEKDSVPNPLVDGNT